MIRSSRAVVTAENHSIVGGLGSAVAELIAEQGCGVRLARVGLQDTYAEGSLDARYLFTKYGLSTQDIVDAAWRASRAEGEAPRAQPIPAETGEYAPV